MLEDVARGDVAGRDVAGGDNVTYNGNVDGGTSFVGRHHRGQ